MPRRFRPVAPVRAAILIAVAASTALAQVDPAEPPPRDSRIEEDVEVQLAEVHILVTDKRGNAITDLEEDEVRVLESGEEQRVAFVEPITGDLYSESGARGAPAPAPLYGAESGGELDVAAVPIVPPRPARRIVFVFDVPNSKMNVREEWRRAALLWAESQMREGDQVAVVVVRSFPDWVLGFTSNQADVVNVLSSISLESGVADRDHSRDMSRLVNDLNTFCTVAEGTQRETAGGRKKGIVAPDAQECSFPILQGYVSTWDIETKATIETLGALAGQLAAIPGQKVVMVFSEGMLGDPSTVAASTVAAMYGPSAIDMSSVVWRLNKNSVRELEDLFRKARAGNVSFFTLDTRTNVDRGFSGMLEQGSYFATSGSGINPWQEMELDTRGTLRSLAIETGGRSYFGKKDLISKVTAAADSYFGHYLVGYYRSNPRAAAGTVKVKIKRRGIDLDYPEQAEIFPHRARAVTVDLTLGAPRIVPGTLDKLLPISLTMSFDALPLRRGGGERGTQLGLFLQAVRPDGTIANEQLDIATIAVTRQEREEAQGKLYMHRTSLQLPDGAYRIRARVSDDRQEMVADRSIDVTLDGEKLMPGLVGVDSGEAVADEPAKAASGS